MESNSPAFKLGPQGNEYIGSDPTPGLAQVILTGNSSILTDMLVTEVLGTDLSQTQVSQSVFYLHLAAAMMANDNGGQWVDRT